MRRSPLGVALAKITSSACSGCTESRSPVSRHRSSHCSMVISAFFDPGLSAYSWKTALSGADLRKALGTPTARLTVLKGLARRCSSFSMNSLNSRSVTVPLRMGST